MIEDIALDLSPEIAFTPAKLKKKISESKGLRVDELHSYRILRRSIDARKKNIKVNLRIRIAYGKDKEIPIESKTKIYKELAPNAPKMIIVGAGPAGLFAALKCIELGIKPIIIERGKPVEERRKDIADLSKNNYINPDSNYCFGEGGAGAFSDGKLYTRSKKRGDNREVLELLHQFGASSDILIDSHPHIGSDKLPEIIKNIREAIIEKGGEIHFNERMTDVYIDNNEATGIVTDKGNHYHGSVMLATGHSARDIYRLLKERNIGIESKGLAIGVRLEHPQQLIDQLQYHSKEGRGHFLPPAEYSFVTQVDNRGVYSFCMCPGGVIVPAMSEPDQCVVNGMSASARSGKWANSGMVVEIHPGDISGYENEGPLEMMKLQEDLERKFYNDSCSYNIPAQRMKDFVEGENTAELPPTSYPNGIHPSRIDKLFPKEISDRLREGFIHFDRKCNGFLTNDAVIMGLESRTSSPVRIPRNQENAAHIEIKNLYPVGEGAGYAGGIVSSAIDGMRSVEKFYNSLQNQNGIDS